MIAKDGIAIDNRTISAEGVTAHAAIPESGVNAIGVLASYLLESISPEGAEKDMLEFLKLSAEDYKGKALGIECSDEYSGYLTCVAGVTTTDEDSITQSFNIRLPVTKTWEPVIEQIKKFCDEKGYVLKYTGNSKPYYIPADSKEINILLDSYRAVTEDNSPPYTIGGGTYAKIFPNTYVYGATQEKYSSLLGKGKGGAHENDEYISQKEFEDCIKIFAHLFVSIKDNI
jgi:succinyl-diaminopimelate desuccinylase